jgi:hypothetical protein
VKRQLEMEPTLARRAPEQLLGLVEAIADGVVVEPETCRGGAEVAVWQRRTQRLSQSPGMLGLRGQRPELLADEGPAFGGVSAAERTPRSRARAEGAQTVEATPKAERTWGELTAGMLDLTLLPRAKGSWYMGDNIPGKPRATPLAAPSRASSLEGLAPALVATVECDPTRDEAADYAVRLARAGVFIELRRLDGLITAFST